MVACRYFDGSSSRARSASVEALGTGLRIVADGVDRIVGIGELRFAPTTGAARIAFASGGLCEFADRDAADALFATLGYRASRADRLASRTSRVVLVALAFVVVMAALYRWGVPWLADETVAHMPRSWDQALGERVLKTLDARRAFRPTELPRSAQDRLLARFDALRTPLQRERTARDAPVVEFRRLGIPNAFALPGDIIVLSDELVALAPDDDAVMTVLAHEAGHLDHRDAMRQLVRSTMTSLIAAWYLGDVSTAAAAAAGGIEAMSYTREAERAADLYALDAIRARGLSTRSAAVLFRRLEDRHAGGTTETEPDADGRARTRRRDIAIPEYLSTHPATSERIRLFDDASPADGSR